jgi:hypothetical protein
MWESSLRASVLGYWHAVASAAGSRLDLGWWQWVHLHLRVVFIKVFCVSHHPVFDNLILLALEHVLVLLQELPSSVA